MRYLIFIFLLFSFLFSSTNNTYAISKKESLYQNGKPLHDWSVSAGNWVAWMKSCQGNGGFAKTIREEVAKLSWPDYKKLSTGVNSFEDRFIAGRCVDSEVQKGKSYLNSYVGELSFLVQAKTGITRSQSHNTQINDNQITETNVNDSIEVKLAKLKYLYDEKLITKKEYDEKRKEILDEM